MQNKKTPFLTTFSLIEKKKSLAAIGPSFPAKKPSPPCLPYGQVKKKKKITNMCARRANKCFTDQ